MSDQHQLLRFLVKLLSAYQAAYHVVLLKLYNIMAQFIPSNSTITDKVKDYGVSI